ncbi:MAG TPA: chromosomal replication initiator protein DnaA [Gemmataceae bacterium]|nr:chromosomal replication initiator protein DnaA [Gemmataceae bacterium]
MTTCDREVVAALEQAIAQRVGERRYTFWFAPHTRFAWDDGLLVVGVPNHFFQDWLTKSFGPDVRAAASAVFGRVVEVQFRIDPELFQAARRAQAESANNTVAAPAPPLVEEAKADRPSVVAGVENARPKRTRRWHRLSDFVVGTGNRLAHAAALTVVESPGTTVNPLVLYGPVGTGKTHLLEGIYAGLRKRHPEWRVVFITAEEFTNRFLQGLRAGKLGAFRKYFRDCDTLLVDDVHFVAGKTASEEEFLHTYDALHSDGRQIVVTCDCHPRLAGDLPALLTDRLIGGAVWGMQPPDDETRLQILRAKALHGEPRLPDDVLRFMADRVRGNVRELEGALQSVRHYGLVTGRAVDLTLAREALADLIRHAVGAVQLAQIDEAVCQVLGLERGALRSKSRTRTTSHPRMLAMYLARKHTPTAHSDIGRYFGGRNHSTVVAAEKKVRQWVADDALLRHGEHSWRVREVLERIERELWR